MPVVHQFSYTCCTFWVLWHKGFTDGFWSVVDVSQRFCSPHSRSASWRASPGPGSHSDSSVLLCDPLPSGANRAGNSRMALNTPNLQLCRWEDVKRCAEASLTQLPLCPAVRDSEQSKDSPVGYNIPHLGLKLFLMGSHLWSRHETIWCCLPLLKNPMHSSVVGALADSHMGSDTQSKGVGNNRIIQ